MSTVSAVGYLVLEPELNHAGNAVRGVRIVQHRANKPKLAQGQIAVKVKLNFDADALLNAIPTIEVDVGGFMTPITEMFAGGK